MRGAFEQYFVLHAQVFVSALHQEFLAFCKLVFPDASDLILVSVAVFLSVDIHQGDKRFSVHSSGKQCAFLSLSALLTARNIPPKFVVEKLPFKGLFI